MDSLICLESQSLIFFDKSTQFTVNQLSKNPVLRDKHDRCSAAESSLILEVIFEEYESRSRTAKSDRVLQRLGLSGHPEVLERLSLPDRWRFDVRSHTEYKAHLINEQLIILSV